MLGERVLVKAQMFPVLKAAKRTNHADHPDQRKGLGCRSACNPKTQPAPNFPLTVFRRVPRSSGVDERETD